MLKASRRRSWLWVRTTLRGVSASRFRLSAFAAVVVAAVGAAHGVEAPPGGAPTWEELGNATYTGFEQLGGQVTLAHGRWEGEPFVPGGAARPTLVAAPGLRATGDLDGDGRDEAVILLSENSGGSGTIAHLAAVGRVALGVRHLATATLGDRVLLRWARIEAGRLVVRVVRAGASDAACCPGEVVDLSWTFAGGSLVPQGPPAIVGRFGLATLGGGEWVLRGWDLDDPVPAAPEVTLAIDGGRIVGSSGCNRYFATAKMSPSPPGQLELGPLAGTRRICAGTEAQVEERFRKLLARVERANFLAGQLALVYRGERGEYGALLFDERRPGAGAPSAP